MYYRLQNQPSYLAAESINYDKLLILRQSIHKPDELPCLWTESFQLGSCTLVLTPPSLRTI
jgi:hypothetical protein